MKTMMKLTVMMIVAGFFASAVYAAETPVVSAKKSELIEYSLLNGVSTDNEGLQTSSAYYLGELKSRKAVIPLMKILHQGKSESIRISAALALIKIGESRGVFAVKQAALHDDSEKVRSMCKVFYADFEKNRKKS